MNKQQDRKANTFNIFSKDLECVKEYPDIKFKPDFNDGYLWFEVFYLQNLENF